MLSTRQPILQQYRDLQAFSLRVGVPQITTNEIREMEERWDALAMTSDTPAVMQDITEVSTSPILSFISLTVELFIWRWKCSLSWHIEPCKCITFQIPKRGLVSTLGICCNAIWHIILVERGYLGS